MKPTKLHNAIVYLLRHSPRPLKRTKLVKLLYLAEVEFCGLAGRTLTGTRWVKDYYGPNTSAVNKAVFEMDGHEVKVEQDFTFTGDPQYLHRPGRSPRFQVDLSSDEERVLLWTLAQYSNRSLESIKREAYGTSPWLKVASPEVRLGTPLDFSDLCRAPAISPPDKGKVREILKRIPKNSRGTTEQQARDTLRVYEETSSHRRKANQTALTSP